MQQILSSNCWPDRAGHVPHWIIVHGTAGFETAQQCAVFFASTASGVSAHYVIGRDGSVIQCVQETAAAWANGGVSGTPLDTPFTGVGDGVHRNTWWNPQLNPNLVTISIEHVKPSTDNSDELTVEQTTASFALIDAICTRWNIPRRVADASGGITGHFSMDPAKKSHCPGPYPWAQLWQYLQGASMVPQGWTDDGTTLTAPNGHKVVQGFRQFVLASQWDAANWPLEEEHGQSPLELSNPKLGGGTQQVFRWTTLEWTAQRGVFVAWSGAEILALRTALAAKKTAIDRAFVDAAIAAELKA